MSLFVWNALSVCYEKVETRLSDISRWGHLLLLYLVRW